MQNKTHIISLEIKDREEQGCSSEDEPLSNCISVQEPCVVIQSQEVPLIY